MTGHEKQGEVAVPHLIQVQELTRVLENQGQMTAILDQVSFNVGAGDLFAVNGPSGSGKSTLLNLLTGIDRPSRGRVIFDGQVVAARSENQLARWRGRHVGIVFQFFQLIPTLTTLENVMLAMELGGRFPRRQWRDRALECLTTVGAATFAYRLPSAISGGQQQRVAIARALANDPPVIVADEPTGNLDSHSAHEVFTVLAGLAEQGRTVIYVTHDAVLAGRAPSGIELLDGRVVGRHGPGSW